MGFAFMVNPLAVIVAALASFLLGWLWYSPLLFARAWMKAAGVSKAEMSKSKKQSMMVTMLTGLIAQIVMAWVLAIVISATGGLGIMDGLIFAFWAWLGFVATIGLGSVLWEGKSQTYFWITALYWLAALLIQGMIIGAWA